MRRPAAPEQIRRSGTARLPCDAGSRRVRALRRRLPGAGAERCKPRLFPAHLKANDAPDHRSDVAWSLLGRRRTVPRPVRAALSAAADATSRRSGQLLAIMRTTRSWRWAFEGRRALPAHRHDEGYRAGRHRAPRAHTGARPRRPARLRDARAGGGGSSHCGRRPRRRAWPGPSSGCTTRRFRRRCWHPRSCS